MTRPNEPCSLCSIIRTTAREKLGSASCGIANKRPGAKLADSTGLVLRESGRLASEITTERDRGRRGRGSWLVLRLEVVLAGDLAEDIRPNAEPEAGHDRSDKDLH